ncbi:hypothetical protein MRX96_042087 [Rhipicephalus microplus]
MTGCCAPNCHNGSGNGKALFAVLREKCAAQVRRRLQWFLRMGREKLPPKRARLCEVFLEHINKACELDSKHQLKLLPHLKPRDLDPSHFEKMNVATAHALFHHSKAAGLQYLVHRNHLPERALTTAFFLEQVFRWLTIMTSRTMQTALSELCPQKGDEAECFLVTFIGMVT